MNPAPRDLGRDLLPHSGARVITGILAGAGMRCGGEQLRLNSARRFDRKTIDNNHLLI
jgi:hypothetical protein